MHHHCTLFTHILLCFHCTSIKHKRGGRGRRRQERKEKEERKRRKKKAGDRKIRTWAHCPGKCHSNIIVMRERSVLEYKETGAFLLLIVVSR